MTRLLTDLVLGVERISTTPSILGALLDAQGDWLERSSLRQIMLGGEKLIPSHIAECMHRLPRLEVASSYGPAEASVRIAYHAVNASTFDARLCKVPIGRPLPNNHIYVVDEDFRPVPAGVVGQLVIGGVHLARGYLNQPTLTAERFLDTPHGSPLGPQRIYCTGDLGYWTADGLLQFIGRMDSQLKIRGQRLEAGEVESALKRYPAVDSAAVVVVPTRQGDQLVAYVHLSKDEKAREDGVLSLWEDHYNVENLYGELNDEAAGNDWSRWVSMYTGEPIPVKEMQEWLRDTIAHLGLVTSDRVLELGVGTGKIALNIIDLVSSFVGTDISSVCVQFMKTQIEHCHLSSRLSVFQAAAHEFESLPKGEFSLVVINSVVQYFPSLEYFDQVISKAIDSMPHGRIFVGDVRSYSLIPYHDVERVLATLDLESTLDDVRVTLERYAEAQSELLLSPAYFYELQARFPQITHVEIKPKSMSFRNELSRYRYTAILHIGTHPNVVAPPTWIDCSGIQSPIAHIRSELRTSSDTMLGVLSIPVSDVQQVRSLLEFINNSDPSSSSETVRSLRRRLPEGLSHAECTPGQLIGMAEGEGWSVILDTSLQGSSGSHLRAIFIRGADRGHTPSVGGFPAVELDGPSHNTLATGDDGISTVLSHISQHLRKSLPPFMIPSQIVPVEELPLNRSGKQDRKLLSTREYLEQYDLVEQTQQNGMM